MRLGPTVKIASLAGISLLTYLLLRSDVAGMLRTARIAGLTVLWLIPYRIVFFALYAWGWRVLLRGTGTSSVPRLRELLWMTSVREAVDRLLPVASVGGGIAGVRMLQNRYVDVAAASASVLVEVLLTLCAVCIFTALGFTLLAGYGQATDHGARVTLAMFVSVLPPVVLFFAMRRGSVFQRLESCLRPLSGTALMPHAAAVDANVHRLLRDRRRLLVAGALQLGALLSASFEIWFILRLIGQPCSPRTAVMLESLTQAARHVAFVVPAGLGVQEVALVMLGSVAGVGTATALAISLIKRAREVCCGVPCLIVWQINQVRRWHANPHS